MIILLNQYTRPLQTGLNIIISYEFFMMKNTETCHVLKEWAVAVNALECAQTIMLLRKGGIHESAGRFQVPHRQILLYPTYEHQQPLMLKPEFADLVSAFTSDTPPETLRISSWAEITDIFIVSDESTVSALLPFHIWNESFVSDRLKWKPKQPLFILLLRAYKLPSPKLIPFKNEYGGCKSWIDLAESVNLANSEPALYDEAYQHQVLSIRNTINLVSRKASQK